MYVKHLAQCLTHISSQFIRAILMMLEMIYVLNCCVVTSPFKFKIWNLSNLGPAQCELASGISKKFGYACEKQIEPRIQVLGMKENRN